MSRNHSVNMNGQVFCGVEGGASVSKLVLVTTNGDVLCELDGPSCNYLLLGIDECHKRLIDMIEEAKKKAGLNSNTPLSGMGLCMSGCEVEDANREFERNFTSKYPNVTENCIVASDTLGPLFTASPKGGLVLIAGTGSNSLLLNPDGTMGRCGGWGHLLGDEASAIWISIKAVKTVFDAEDNLVQCPYDITRVKELMLQHFKVTDKVGIIKHSYTNFNKTSFAGLCARLANAATNENDPLCCHLFYEAGKVLAAMVVALKPKVQKELLESDLGLPIVCVGSVFKSWHLLQKGFVEGLGNHYKKCTLLTLNCSSAIGAAYLGAKTIGHKLPLNFAKNISVLYTFEA